MLMRFYHLPLSEIEQMTVEQFGIFSDEVGEIVTIENGEHKPKPLEGREASLAARRLFPNRKPEYGVKDT